MNIPPRNPIPFDRPAIYQICVQGQIDPNWTNNLEGMAVQLTSVEVSLPVTNLVGELCDQAALAGVLNTLYELHMTLILVKRLEP